MKLEKQYDFIIVGSGIGGLSSAVVLAKNGYSVLVLEKNNQIGGALQVFSRDKCIFDTGVHYIGGLDKGENLYRMFKYLGIYDSLKLRSLDRDCFDLIRMPDGNSCPHGQGYESFTSQLIHLFPAEENAIYSFCKKLKEICAFFPLYNLEIGDGQTYYNNPEILSLGAWDYVNSITNNQTLRSILLGSGPLYAGDQQSTPLYVVALIMNSYIKGSYRLVDGGSQIAKLLVRELRKYNGEILKRKEVNSANYGDNNHITSVVCTDGTEYRAKNFISNMHPSLTIDIFGKEKFRPAYRDRVQKLENTTSSLMVYFSLKENSFPYYNYNIYDHFSYDCWNSINDNSENWPHTLYVCTPASSKSEEFAESLCIMCYMNLKDVEEWENTFNTTINPSERNAAYLKFKKDKEEQIIKRLETRYPDFRSCIKNVYSSTPLTYRDYIGTPEGSLYGIKKDFNNPIGTTINSKTRVPNLYLTGQNIIFHGILGATIGSFVTCFNFLNHIEIINKINDYEK